MHNTTSQTIISLLAGMAGAVIFSLLQAPAHVGPFFSYGTLGTSSSTHAFAPASAEEAAVIAAVKKAKPAVVSIVISEKVPVIEQYYEQNPIGNDPFFQQFFGNNFPGFNFSIPKERQNGTREQDVGGGSGFLVSADGLIITNKHVVADSNAKYTVFTNDGVKHAATVVARDPLNDLAVIKIKGANYATLSFADSSSIQVGQTAIAIGNALGEFRNTVSVGVVSGLSRSVTAGDNFSGQTEQLSNVIQTDAAINPGNSGGPLLNSNGDVIGVNVAMAQSSQNIGFALPANLAQSVVASVKKSGKIVRPFLGVRYMQITPDIKDQNKLSVDYGALVLRGQSASELAVIPGSPADKAGVRENDIILEADGQKLDSDHTLTSIIAAKHVGDNLTLKLLSKGVEKTAQVKLEAAP